MVHTIPSLPLELNLWAWTGRFLLEHSATTFLNNQAVKLYNETENKWELGSSNIH